MSLKPQKPEDYDEDLEKEKRKISELFREIKTKGEKEEDKLTWMYKNPSESVNREEYLLGRSVDKALENASGRGTSDQQSNELANLPKKNREDARSQVDQAELQRKLHEDPLFAIRQKEIDARKKLLNNPVKMKEMKKLIEAENKKKLKAEKKWRKQQRQIKLENKINLKLIKELKKHSEDLDIKALLDDSDDSGGSDSGEPRKKKRKKRRKDESDSSDSEESEDDRTKRRKTEKKRKRVKNDDRSEKRKKSSKPSRLSAKKGKKRSKRSESSSSDSENVKKKKSKRTKSDSDSSDDKKSKRKKKKINKAPASSSSSSDSEASDSSSSSDEPQKSKKDRKRKGSPDRGGERQTSRRHSVDEEPRKHKAYGLSTLEGSKPHRLEKPVAPYKKKEEEKQKIEPRRPMRLSEKEKDVQLKEMMENAKWRKKERESDYLKHKKAKQREEKIDDYDESFMKNQLAKMSGSGSMADRIKSNINNIQRSSSSMDNSFMRK